MNCAMGGYGPQGLNEVESIDIQLRYKGICEKNGYSIYHQERGEFRVFVIKYDKSSVARIFDDEFEAIEEFIKLSNS